MGLLVGGSIVLMWGAGACVAGFAGKTVVALGVTGKQAVAWGILAYDVFPMFLAPLLGMEMETLEYPT